MSEGCQDVTDLGQFLVDKARSVDTGEMVCIIAKTPLGIEWRSSLKGDWFMQIPSMKKLVRNWNEVATVNWFWDATFVDGSEAKACVSVHPAMMQEIKSYLKETFPDGSQDL